MELSIKTEHFTPKFLHITHNVNNNLTNTNSFNNNNHNNHNNNHRHNYNLDDTKFFPLSYKTPTLTLNNLLIESPWLDAPFGINNYLNEKDKNDGKYYLDISFNGYAFDTEIKNFYRVIDNIDNYILNFIDNYYECYEEKKPKKDKNDKNDKNEKNGKEDKSIDKNGKEDKSTYQYNKQIRFNKTNPRFPPTMKLKIFENVTKVVDLYGVDIKNFVNYIKPNSKVQALLKCNGVWCFDNKWGLSWNVCKLIVKQHDFLPEYPFIEDKDSKDSKDSKDNNSNQTE